MIDSRTAPYAATLLRVALGVMFIAHALLKYLVFTLPGALAYVTFGAELVGGLLILGGVRARWVALALVPVLLGATWAHGGNGWVFSAPNGGWEYPAFLTISALVMALIGDGKFALVPDRRASI